MNNNSEPFPENCFTSINYFYQAEINLKKPVTGKQIREALEQIAEERTITFEIYSGVRGSKIGMVLGLASPNPEEHAVIITGEYLTEIILTKTRRYSQLGIATCQWRDDELTIHSKYPNKKHAEEFVKDIAESLETKLNN